LFVCICVLYYCHRVATQLKLNISYHVIYLHLQGQVVQGDEVRTFRHRPHHNAEASIFAGKEQIRIGFRDYLNSQALIRKRKIELYTSMLCRSADHSLSKSTTNVTRAHQCLISRASTPCTVSAVRVFKLQKYSYEIPNSEGKINIYIF